MKKMFKISFPYGIANKVSILCTLVGNLAELNEYFDGY